MAHELPEQGDFGHVGRLNQRRTKTGRRGDLLVEDWTRSAAWGTADRRSVKKSSRFLPATRTTARLIIVAPSQECMKAPARS